MWVLSLKSAQSGTKCSSCTFSCVCVRSSRQQSSLYFLLSKPFPEGASVVFLSCFQRAKLIFPCFQLILVKTDLWRWVNWRNLMEFRIHLTPAQFVGKGNRYESQSTLWCWLKKTERWWLLPLSIHTCRSQTTGLYWGLYKSFLLLWDPTWNTVSSSGDLEGFGPAGASAEEATKRIRGMEHLSCADRLEVIKPGENFRAYITFQHLKRA